MTLQSHVGAFDIGTGAPTTTVVVTGVGFQPQAIIFWWSGIASSTDAVVGQSIRAGYGFAVSPTDRRAVNAASQDGQATSATNAYHTNVACIAFHDWSGSLDGLADLQSMDGDGFTLVIDDQFPTNWRIHYLAFGGNDISNVGTGQFTLATSTGNQAVTGIGFQPDVVFFLSADVNSAPPASKVHAELMFGCGISSSQRYVSYTLSLNGLATSQTSKYTYSGECIYLAGPTNDSRADFVSLDVDGFTIDNLEVQSPATYMHYLVIQGGQWIAGDLLTLGDTITEIIESGFGFQPVGSLFHSTLAPESTQDVREDDWERSVGAFSGTTERGVQTSYDRNGQSTTQCANGVEHDEVYLNISTIDAIDGLMDIQSIDSDGFTCIMDDRDPGGALNFVWYTAFGSEPVLQVPLISLRHPMRNPSLRL